MKLTFKHAAIASAFALLATSTVSLAQVDVRDPGRLPRKDKLKDPPAPAVPAAAGQKVGTAAVEVPDVRDPGHPPKERRKR